MSASLGSFARPGVILGLLLAAWGGAALVFSLQSELVPALVLVALPGVCHFTFSGIALTLVQTRTPDHLRGRAISIYVLTIVGISPLGAFVLGSVGSVLGIETALGWAAALSPRSVRTSCFGSVRCARSDDSKNESLVARGSVPSRS